MVSRTGSTLISLIIASFTAMRCAAFQLLNDAPVAFPVERVEYRKSDPAAQQQRRDRSDRQADAQQGAGGLHIRCRHIAGELQDQQDQRDSHRRGCFLCQRDQAVEHPLVSLTGLPFVPFDCIRQDRPGQHMRGAHSDAGQHAQTQDQRQRRGGVQGDQYDLHDRPESNPRRISLALVPLAGGKFPEWQDQHGSDEDHRHDQVAIRLALDHIFDEI